MSINQPITPTVGKRIVIPFSPQGYQREILDSPIRFKVVRIGRRGGKTVLAINHLIRSAVRKPDLYWYVAPTYRQVKQIAWALLKKFLVNDRDWKFNEVELRASHPIGTAIELKGADNPDTLRGVGLGGAVLDEEAMMQDIFPEIIRPMLVDRKGGCLFISTPKGRNHFFDYCQMEKKHPSEWKSWHYPTSVNSYIPKEEIELARKGMPERVFQQEFDAEFVDDDTSVFKNWRKCVVGTQQPPVEGRFYVIGVDLARHEDYSVFTVLDSVTRHVVAWERYNNLSWTFQKERIQRLAKHYNNALCIVDASGVGDPIVEDLQNYNVSVEPFKFTNESKKELIERLQLALEQRVITFPSLEDLIGELVAFEYKITDMGRVTYGAPAGKHDDCVISLALALYGIRRELYSAQIVQKRVDNEDPIDRQGQGIPIYDYEAEPNISGY